jgi:hypothetical protein
MEASQPMRLLWGSSSIIEMKLKNVNCDEQTESKMLL